MNPYISNPELSSPVSPPGWKGTPLDSKNLFTNIEHPYWPKFNSLWRWQFERNLQKHEKKKERWRHHVQLLNEPIQAYQNGLMWLGHATFLINLGGKWLLTDPVFAGVWPLKRLHPLPISVHQLPMLDYVLLSHAHRDHCDKRSLEALSKFQPQARIYTGLKVDEVIRKFKVSNQIETAGWYQQFSDQQLDITYLPSRHWARRGLTDINTTLWGAMLIAFEGYKIYFGGDSGYGNHYEEFSQLFGAPDLALLGCGAYKPEWFMSSAHTSPQMALQAAADLGAKTFIPMHYGTFDLSDEPLGEPHRILKDGSFHNIYAGHTKLLNPGEWYSFNQ